MVDKLYERGYFLGGVCLNADPLYDTVRPATGLLSHLVPNCSSKRRYPMKDVAKESWAPDTTLSLYLLIRSPPKKIPTATAGRFSTPERKKHNKQCLLEKRAE